MTDQRSTRAPRRHSSPLVRFCVWALSGVFMLAFLAGLTVVMVVGQSVPAPDWLSDRVEARLERGLDGMQIDFGAVYFIVHKGWRPRLRLQDVTLSGADGRVLAHLADAEASLAMRPLLDGQVRPKRIALNGAFATLGRDGEGNFSLAFEGAANPVARAGGLAHLVESLDRVLLRPELESLVAIEVGSVTLRYEDQVQGRAWTLDGGHVLVTRSQANLRVSAGFSLLSGRDHASSFEANYTSQLGSRQADFGISVSDLAAGDVAAQSPALVWLNALQAPVSGSLRGGLDADGALGPVSATLQIGAGAVQPNPQARPIPFTGARTYFTYDPGQQVLDFSQVAVDSAWGSAEAEGRAYLAGLDAGRLDSLVGQFALTRIALTPGGLFAEPPALDRAAVEFRLVAEPFELTLGRLDLAGGDSTLSMHGRLSAPEGGWALDLDGHLDRLTPAQLLSYWPAGAAPNPREWVRQNLIAGDLEDLDLALRLRGDAKPVIYADFSFADTTIRYNRHLPVLEQASGEASLTGRRFAVTAHSGLIRPDLGGAVDASGSSFIIPDIGIRRAAPGIARIRGAGSVTAMLSLLDRPPLRIPSKANLPVALAEGRVRMRGTLALPLKKGTQPEDMEYHFTGTLEGMRSTVLVPGHELSAPRLQASGDHRNLTMSGDGFLGAVPVSVRWDQPIGKNVVSRVSGRAELSQALLDEVGVALPPGSVSGSGFADFDIELGAGRPPVLSATTDLDGVGLSIPALGWSKSRSGQGEMAIEVTLGSAPGVDRLSLDAAGLVAEGAIDIAPGGGLGVARFDRVRLGSWLNVAADLIGRGAGTPDIRVRGGTLDLRGADFGGGRGGGGSQRIQARLDRLQVTETIALAGFSGEFSTGPSLSGNFTAQINGQTPISGQAVPSGGGTGFVIRSNDAGGVFRSAGLLRQAHGGDFQMSLQPVAQSDAYDGVLRVRETRIKDAPTMAALLNAISLVGLLDEMAGQGIFFSAIDSRFRLAPGLVTITQGSAEGPSIGLSFAGHVDTAGSRYDMRGTISPIYMLNAIGGAFSARRGEGLIGFNYTLTGALAAPQVFVNPLSSLAPGVLRDILRAPPPTVQGGPSGPALLDEDDTNNAPVFRGEDR